MGGPTLSFFHDRKIAYPRRHNFYFYFFCGLASPRGDWGGERQRDKKRTTPGESQRKNTGPTRSQHAPCAHIPQKHNQVSFVFFRFLLVSTGAQREKAQNGKEKRGGAVRASKGKSAHRDVTSARRRRRGSRSRRESAPMIHTWPRPRARRTARPHPRRPRPRAACRQRRARRRAGQSNRVPTGA